MTSSLQFALLLFTLSALPLVAGAQAPPSATSEPRAVEVEVQATDAGTAISSDDASRLGLGSTDGGVSLHPPTLVADSPAAWPQGLEGAAAEVGLELLVDAQGAVTEVKVLEAAEHAPLTEAAVKAAPGLRFSPATLGGQPVSVRLRFVYRFEPPAGVSLAQAW
ncbi:energy transducer TonB, partial [Pyxidicoccus sp. 3LFB2]